MMKGRREYLHYGDYVVLAAIVAGIVWLLVRRRRNGRAEPAISAAGDGEP